MSLQEINNQFAKEMKEKHNKAVEEKIELVAGIIFLHNIDRGKKARLKIALHELVQAILGDV